MKTSKKAKDTILIYGENGIGKSNYASIFGTINNLVNTRTYSEAIKRIIDNRNNNPLYIEKFMEVVSRVCKDIRLIAEDSRTINAKGNTLIELGFICKGKDARYVIEYNDKEIVREELDYVLNTNKVNFFTLTANKFKINQDLFIDKKYYKEFIATLKQYFGKHSFIALMLYDIFDKSNNYILKAINKNLINIISYLNDINYIGNDQEYILNVNENTIDVDKIYSGTISLKDKKKLQNIEEVLDKVFTSLYSDIKKVYYEYVEENNRINYCLYVKKLIYGEIKDIEFIKESTGTKNILKLIPSLIALYHGKTVVVDEFDTGIHDIMVDSLLNNFRKYNKGELIITTHNTLLIESDIPKDNIYIFKVDKDANKELIPITSIAGRIQATENSRKKYLKGLYGGIPITSDIDFDDVLKSFK